MLSALRVTAAAVAAAKSLQSCPTLCDLIDGSPPGSTVSFVKNKAPTQVWVYFWALYLVPLVFILVLCQCHAILMTVAL